MKRFVTGVWSLMKYAAAGLLTTVSMIIATVAYVLYSAAVGCQELSNTIQRTVNGNDLPTWENFC